jgi:hypothetical protein
MGPITKRQDFIFCRKDRRNTEGIRSESLVNRSIPMALHGDFYRNAILRNRELARQRSDHQARHVERWGNFLAPGAFTLLQVIEYPDRNRERAILLDNIRVQPREAKIVLFVTEDHKGSRSSLAACSTLNLSPP